MEPADRTPPLELPTNRYCKASLILGLLCWVPCFLFFTSLPAVICGHKGLAQVKLTGAPGAGKAIAGLILGYLNLALAIAFFILLLPIGL